MPGPGGHGGHGGGPGGHRGSPGGGPGMGGHGMGGHRPPHNPPMGGGWGSRRSWNMGEWGHRPPPRRGCCGCILPVMAMAVMAVVGFAMLLF